MLFEDYVLFNNLFEFKLASKQAAGKVDVFNIFHPLFSIQNYGVNPAQTLWCLKPTFLIAITRGQDIWSLPIT